MSDSEKVDEAVVEQDDRPDMNATSQPSWRSKKTPRVKTVSIQLDGTIAAEIETAQAALVEAKRADSRSDSMADAPKAPIVQERLNALIEQAQDTVQVFKFRSIGRQAYELLLRKHKPTAAQRKEEKTIQFNPDTFPPALVAAASYDPVITEEEAIEIFDDPDWNNAELLKLYFAAEGAQSESTDIPLSSTATGQILDSVLKSITPANAAFPDLSS